MKLGAQLYSVRHYIQTPSDTRETFLKIREMGYENVQFSGGGAIPAEVLRDISEETGLPIVCTHTKPERILNDTDAVIREHKLFGCPVIGLGAMPKEYREGPDGVDEFIRTFDAAAQKIMDAGLGFSYHNHAFELTSAYDGERNFLDVLLERCPDWLFLADTYWIHYAGKSVTGYLEKIGSKRLVNVHFKDMAKDDSRAICACGEGVLDFRMLNEFCLKMGVKNILVEQDNADDCAGGCFEQMRTSFRNLRPIITAD